MKVYLRGYASRLPWYTSMEPSLRFALSQPVTNGVIGCDDIAQLEQNVDFAGSFTTMTPEEQQALIRDVSPFARYSCITNHNPSEIFRSGRKPLAPGTI